MPQSSMSVTKTTAISALPFISQAVLLYLKIMNLSGHYDIVTSNNKQEHINILNLMYIIFFTF